SRAHSATRTSSRFATGRTALVLRRTRPPSAVRHTSRSLPQGSGPTNGVDTALVGAVDRAGVAAHELAGEEQLRVRVVLGGFEFSEQRGVVRADGKGRVATPGERVVVP